MSKQDLVIQPAQMNAAGTAGFDPDIRNHPWQTSLGAFITNPVSWHSRTPARGTRVVEFPGGFLLHTGLTNPGFKAALRRYRSSWERSPLPVIVHLLGEDPEIMGRMVQSLEGINGVHGIEIGLPLGAESSWVQSILTAARGELPMILRVPFEQAWEIAGLLNPMDVSYISIGAPRGSLPTGSGETVSGRLYGPAVFPQAFALVRDLADLDIPVIGCGGVYSSEQKQLLLDAGAAAVQFDSVLWLDPGLVLDV